MSPEQFLAVGDLFSEAALLVDRAGTILAANRHVKSLGFTPHALCGQRLVDLTPAAPDQVEDYLRLCARSRDPVVGALTLRNDAGEALACRCDGALVHPGSDGEAQLLIKLQRKEESLVQFAVLNQKVTDLTAEIARRRAVERELWDQRESLRVTLASIGDGVIVTDPEGYVTFLNAVAETLTGWTQLEAEGRFVEEVFHIVNEQTRQKTENPAVRALREGRIVGLANHTVLIARDGVERIIDDSAAPICEQDGDVLGVVLVFRDVTETRSLESARSRLAALVESSEDAIIAKTFDGVVTGWNRGAERLFGYEAQETLGRPLYETIVPPERKDELLQVLDRVRQGERVDHFETLRVAKDGRRIPVSLRISPIYNAASVAIGASAIERDITQQKQADRLRAVRLAVTQILAEERDVEQATLRMLQAVGLTLGWDVGCFWHVDPRDQVLRCAGVWTDPSNPRTEFVEATHNFTFKPGDSLPGRVWSRNQPVWSPDATRDPQFLRGAQARACGLHGAFGFPLTVSGEFVGVLEFFRSEIQEPDDVLLELMGTLAAQFGHFIERRRAEQETQNVQRLLRNVLDNTPAVIYVKDDKGRFLLANQRLADLVGRPMADIVGRGNEEVLGDDEHVRQIAEHDRLVLCGTEARAFEERLRRPDGLHVYHSIKAPAENIGYAEKVLIGITTDISEQKHTEAKLRFLADASASLAVLVDYKSTLQRVARLAVPHFADWCAVDMVAPDNSVEQLAVAHVDPAKVELAKELSERYPRRPDAAHGVAQVLRTGKPDLMTEITDDMLQVGARDAVQLDLLRRLGLKSLICVPLVARNRVLGVITFVSAESGRRYTADDLAMAEDLAHRATIAIENARLYQEVREADRRKDEFLAMLAHELRNPLAPIRTGLDVLALEGAGDRETIQLMQEQVEHLVRLVDDLLDVSRIIRGRVELRCEPVETATLIRRAVEAVRPMVAQHEQELVVRIPDRPLWLNADPVRLVQVIGNLLNNASKYTDRGGRIEISATARGDEVELCVSDNGIGIEPDLLHKVFDPFTQASRSLDRSQGGLGIGLTLVRSLVEMHGGSVSAHSEGVGHGSQFVVRLPTISAPQETAPGRGKHNAARQRRILVVDDNVGAAQMLAVLLSTLGAHEVKIVHDGPAALAQVETFRPEIVLLDIGLPGMDGYQVGWTIRRSPQFDSMLLVALTGYGQEEDRRRSQEAGFDEHLVKPPSLKHIEAILSHPKLNGDR